MEADFCSVLTGSVCLISKDILHNIAWDVYILVILFLSLLLFIKNFLDSYEDSHKLQRAMPKLLQIFFARYIALPVSRL